MVPLPRPDFESTYAFAPPVSPPPRTTPLAIPASLQAAVVSKSIPLVGQNKFSRVEPFDGTFVDKIPIAPPDLFKLIAEHKDTSVDVLLTGDGAPYLSATQVEEPNEKTPTYVPGISYSIADYGMANFTWSSLVGRSTLLILPEFAPWQDEAPFLSPKTFVQACIKVLEEGKTQGVATNIFFGYMSKVAPPNPTLAPLLDRRVDFFKLNGWISEIMVLPMMKFSTRSRDLSLVSMTTPSTFPPHSPTSYDNGAHGFCTPG